MANVKITELGSASTPLSGSELIEIVQGGVNKKVEVNEVGGGGGVTEFTELTDTPASYTGQASKVVAVKVDESGLEFVAGGGSQDLQSVLDEGNTATNGTEILELSPNLVGILSDEGYIGVTSINQEIGIYLGTADLGDGIEGYINIINSSNGAEIRIRASNITEERDVQFPDKDGTIAMLDDIINPPDATPTVKGIAKLYTSLGSNTDGAVDQNTVNTALSAKANAPLIDTVSSSALTGVTTEGILKSYLIPANTYSASEILNFANDLYKTGTAGTVTSRLYTNTTASLSGASLLATTISTAGNRKVPLRRQLVLKDGNIEVLSATASTPDDNVNSSSPATIVTFNPAVDNYFITTAQNASAGDSTLQNNFKLHY